MALSVAMPEGVAELRWRSDASLSLSRPAFRHYAPDTGMLRFGVGLCSESKLPASYSEPLVYVQNNARMLFLARRKDAGEGSEFGRARGQTGRQSLLGAEWS